MDVRLFLGNLLAYSYNHCIGKCPSRHIRSWFLHRYLGAYGHGSAIQMGCHFLNGRKVHLGERNAINFGCLFDGRRYRIITGNDVSIGPEAAILTLGHDPQSPGFADRGGDVVIGDHVWIGYRAIILPGINIGEGAVVAAGAVVTRNVDPFSIVAGNPARVINARTKNLEYRLHHSPFLR